MDENTVLPGLSGPCDPAVIPIALKIAKNVEYEVHLRCYALELVYKNISTSVKHFNQQVISDLKAIVQETNNVNENYHCLQMKRYAFSCLQSAISDLSDDVYYDYYGYLKKQLEHKKFESQREKTLMQKITDGITTFSETLFEALALAEVNADAFFMFNGHSDRVQSTVKILEDQYQVPGLEKVDKFMKSCTKVEKYRMLKTLSICISESTCGINISIFEEFPLATWGKELLTYTLLSSNRLWDVSQTPHFVREIEKLSEFLDKYKTRYSIEDVLELLITTQKTCQLDVGFIAKVLALLRCNKSLKIIFRDFCFLPSVVSKLEVLQLRRVCDAEKIIYNDKQQIKNLQSLLLYSDEVVNSILSKFKPQTDIGDLIDFLTFMKDIDVARKEEILLQLAPNKSIDEWKQTLYFPRIEALICREFPAYDYKTAVTISTSLSVDADKKYFSPVTSKEISLPYHKFDYLYKEELNRQLECGENRLLLIKYLYDLNTILSKLVAKCGLSDELFNQICTLIVCLDSEGRIIHLVNALEILFEYNIDISKHNIFDIISFSTELNIEEKIHHFVVQKTFPGTYEKSVDQLISELIKLNKEEDISLLKAKDDIRDKFQKVMDAYNGKSVLFPDGPLIKNWNTSGVKAWARAIKISKMEDVNDIDEILGPILFLNPSHGSHLGAVARAGLTSVLRLVMSGAPTAEEFEKFMNTAVSQYEKVAIIKRAIELTTDMQPRDIQILAVLLLLNYENNKGRLGQINTGEGKTITIAMIAAYHALEGSTVDIITSSKLLAIPQSEELAKFYNVLRLTVAHNFDNFRAYKSNVVYGTSLEFQGDILRDEFRKLETRHGRKCDVTIVDEVDNMLIDDNSGLVYLSCDMPAMDHLETILATIYAQVKAAASSIVEENGEAFFIEQENAFDENGQVKDEVTVTYNPIKGSKRDFIIKSTEQHIRNLIRDCDETKLSKDFPEIKIPKHLREFICKVQLKQWVQKALAAKFTFVKGEDYILFDNEVKIVDAENTGVVKLNSHWSDGLHQFVEIKHGARINPESLTTNYLSNVGFFRRYRPKIYGLTGTLGDSGTRNMLRKTYNLDTVTVPPFKLKQHKELSAIVVENRDHWYREIISSCLRKLNSGRAVLIIMEYIRETEAVEKIFIDDFNYDKKKIKLYKTNKHASVVEKPLNSGDVLITTNIAGRGTDIKLTKGVEENGGLHVCVTFLPKNSRVEEQNTGRTSRTGNRGTSQFILCRAETNITTLRENRSVTEVQTLKNAQKEIDRVTTQDEIFQKFCRLTDDIKGRNEFVRSIEKEAVEERFAIWLKLNDDKIRKGLKDDAFESFEVFLKDVMTDDRSQRLIKNPYLYVKCGNKYLTEKNYKKAITEYTLAIELDEHFAEHAHYNRGYAYIAEYGGHVVQNEYYIDEAVSDFKEARKLIEQREYNLHLMQHASESEVFSKQISSKLDLYNIQKNAIDQAIGPDKNAINSMIRQLKKKKQSDQLTSDDKAEISKRIDDLKTQKNSVGVIEKARSHDTARDLKIEIHELNQCLPENDKLHDKEITEFQRNGAIGAFRVSEIPPIDWPSIMGLLLLGFGQLIVGAALTVFTFGGGASFGMGLITEGISDIVTAVKDGIINRDFSWARWAIEKAISLTVSVVCAGLKAMKDVAKTAYAGAKSAISIGSKVMTQTVKEGWKIVAKKVGFELSKGIGKEIVNGLANYGVSKTLIPIIQQEIINKISGPIQEALENNRFVKIMLELDEKNKNHHYETRLKSMGQELLNPASSISKVFDLQSIAMKIGNRIADNKIPGLSTLRQVNTALEAVVELTTLTPKFIAKLNKSIDKQAKKDKIEEKANKIKSEKDAIDKEQISTVENDIKKTEDDIDLKRLNEEDEQVTLKLAHGDSKSISRGFVNTISTTIVNSIQQKMITPIINATVNYSVDAVTKSVNASLHEQTETYRAHKRIIHHQNVGFTDKKKSKKTKQSDDVTEAELREMKIDQLIDDLRSGGPSGLLHLGAASDAIDKPIEVYDEKGKLKYVIGDTKQGPPAQVQYHEPKNGESVGHYTLPGGKEPLGNNGGKNMCLYNVLASQTHCSPNELKNSCVSIMENNKSHMAKQVGDITRLEMYSNVRLAMGGVTYTGRCPDDAQKVLDNSLNSYGYGFDRPGHPHIHAPFRNKTKHQLEALSKVLKKKVEVYDKNGILIKTYGADFDGDPIQFDHHKPAGDTSGEWLSSRNGKEVYRFQEPGDTTFYKIVNQQTGCDVNKLKNDMSAELNKIPVNDIPCVESETQNNQKKSAFITDSEMAYVTHHALNSSKVKRKMQEMNRDIRLGNTRTRKDLRKPVWLSKRDLNCSRKIYGMQWQDGKPISGVMEIETVCILLQHRDGEQNNPNGEVHVMTIYPKYPDPP